ncbi:hypothetical protein DITRI_Ditri14bG0145500 [Diplodiscus trichospermus]
MWSILKAYQFVCLVLFFLNFQAYSSLCDDLGIKSYPKTNLWKEDIDCCEWDGVTCDNDKGQVIGLDLSCSWLHGTIPSNSSLFLLPHLQKLNLAFNDFNYSKISSEFGRFASLVYLNLSNAKFAGAIPSELSQLSKLVSLDLSGNYVQSLEQHTLGLSLSYNAKITSAAYTLPKLQYLYLSSCNISEFPRFLKG